MASATRGAHDPYQNGYFQCCVCLQWILETPLVSDVELAEYFEEPNYTALHATLSCPENLKTFRGHPKSMFWQSLFRAVIPPGTNQTTSSKHLYKISGVRQAYHEPRSAGVGVDQWTTLTQWVPTDPNVACLSQIKDTAIETYTFSMGDIRTAHTAGDSVLGTCELVIHDRCWCLLNKVIGEDRIREDFNLLFRVLPNYREFKCLDRDTLGYYRVHVESLRFSNIHMSRATKRDPWWVEGLANLIADAIQSQSAKASQSPLARTCYRHLPAELQFLIFDSLYADYGPGGIWLAVRSILNASWAFGWDVADQYWRARFPHDVVFEYWDIKWVDLDWKMLYLRVLKMMYGPSHHRQMDIKWLLDRQAPEMTARMDTVRVAQYIKILLDRSVEASGIEQLLSHKFFQSMA